MNTEDCIQRLTSDLSPVARLRSVFGRLMIWLGSALLCVGAGALLTGLRPDLHTAIWTADFLFEGLLLLIGAILSAVAAMVLSVPGCERAGRKWRLFALFPVFGWLLYIGTRGFSGGGWVLAGEARFSPACAGELCLLSILPGVAMFLMIKNAAPVQLGWNGFLAALAALFLASLGLHFSCPNSSAVHVLAWHALPVLTVAASGIFLGRLLLRW